MRRAWTEHPLLSVSCSPAAWRAAWAAATRRASAIGGATILQRVLACLTPQCGRIIINANGDPARFADTGLPVVADSVPDFAGPLAGILAGLDWAAANAPDIEWLVSVPGDCPFLPKDLVARLHEARVAADVPLACARSGEWRHPVVGLWPVSIARGFASRAGRAKACTRSSFGPHGTASPSPSGRRRRLIRSSTSIRRRTRRRPKPSRRRYPDALTVAIRVAPSAARASPRGAWLQSFRSHRGIPA